MLIENEQCVRFSLLIENEQYVRFSLLIENEQYVRFSLLIENEQYVRFPLLIEKEQSARFSLLIENENYVKNTALLAENDNRIVKHDIFHYMLATDTVLDHSSHISSKNKLFILTFIIKLYLVFVTITVLFNLEDLARVNICDTLFFHL